MHTKSFFEGGFKEKRAISFSLTARVFERCG